MIFFNGNRLEQDSLYTSQIHLVYTFRPGLWAAASAGYGYGGESTVNGVEKNDRRENLAWAISFGYPITRQLGVKVVYLASRTKESVGQDTDSIGVGFAIFWWYCRDKFEKKILQIGGVISTDRADSRTGSLRF